jgi:helicase
MQAALEPRKETVLKLKHHADPVFSIAEDTFAKDRQLIVFVNTKRGAESQAEKIAGKQSSTEKLKALSEEALHALPSPTKQCKRLAYCLERGIAFHHAGLSSKQRDIIEEGFKQRVIKCICATPTLAAGVDLPAFRVVIRDLKRYGGNWGMTPLSVLEYEQMCGRAGRPGKDPWGEAICIAKDTHEQEEIRERYVKGEPEEIYSKLAVEPVLRTYVLSLVASEFIKDVPALFSFFDKTFYAHQYGHTEKLRSILHSMIEQLRTWEFLELAEGEGVEKEKENERKGKERGEEKRGEGEKEERRRNTSKADFISAADLGQNYTKKKGQEASPELLCATVLGKRVSELYLDPYTAHHIIIGLRRSEQKIPTSFAYLHLIAATLELRPYLHVKQSELELVEEQLAKEEDHLLHIIGNQYTEAYETYLETIKTTMLFAAWIQEESEETLMESYGVRPGELHAKLELMDWIIYAGIELAKITGHKKQQNSMQHIRIRLKHGVKEELLPLLKLRSIGRVRARKLYKNGITDVAGIERTDLSTLAQLIGKAIAIDLKEQVGQKCAPEDVIVLPNKRKGQRSIHDY